TTTTRAVLCAARLRARRGRWHLRSGAPGARPRHLRGRTLAAAGDAIAWCAADWPGCSDICPALELEPPDLGAHRARLVRLLRAGKATGLERSLRTGARPVQRPTDHLCRPAARARTQANRSRNPGRHAATGFLALDRTGDWQQSAG